MKSELLTLAIGLSAVQFGYTQGSIDVDTNIQMGIAGTEHIKITDSGFSLHENPASPLIYGDFNTGNVGIGTTPSNKLHVDGNLQIEGGIIHNQTADFVMNSRNPIANGQRQTQMFMLADAFYLRADKDNDNDKLGRVFILADKVGVGTDAPAQKLDVNGSVNVNGSLVVKGKTAISDRIDVSKNVSYSSGSWFNIYNNFSTGSYVCYVKNFRSAGYGGNIYHYSATFNLSWYYSTNSSDSWSIPVSGSSHAMNGRSVSFRVKNSTGHNKPNLQMLVSGESVSNVPFTMQCMKLF